jgi:hypothetical protein
MNWITNIFKSKAFRYADELYLQVKQDKEQLITENKELREQNKDLNQQLIALITNNKYNHITPNNNNNSYVNVKDINPIIDKTPQRLTKKEKFILELVDKYKTFDEVLKHSGCKEQSLKVYISRIRGKNYIIKLD